MEVTLNNEQRLFVMRYADGYSCLGFDVVYRYCLEAARRIKKFVKIEPTPVVEAEIGTLVQYQQYQDFIGVLAGRKTGTWFDHDTPKKVRDILEAYRENGGTLRLFYGDRETGRSWMDECNMLGEIGRSTGTMQVPLLIPKGEYGGCAILDGCIVRIIDADTRADLYRHKSYHLPEIEIRSVDEQLARQGYTHGAWVKEKNGSFENHANFRSYGKAAQWVAFMSGDCTEQPE